MALDKNSVCSGDLAGGSDVFFSRSYGSVDLEHFRFRYPNESKRGMLFCVRAVEK
jgi:hypothetical protein